jgi:uncharacterized protein (DUF58 family)
MAKTVLSRYIQPEVLGRLAHLGFVPRELVEGTLAGAHKSPFSGFSVEFAGHREYVPGDDLRHLDWKVYFRHGKFFIKQYELETNLVCHIMLDISASMRYGRRDQQKLLYASRMAVTLAHLIIEQTDRVSFATFDTRARQTLQPSSNLTQIIQITELLDQTEAIERTQIGPPLLDLADRAGRRGIVIILSDFFVDLDDLEQAIQRLRYERHEVVLMQVMHHDELVFDLEGTARFVGLETDEQFLTRPQDIRRAYLDALASYVERLETICESNRCERVEVDTSRSMAEVLADYMHKRSLVRRMR